MEVTFFTCADKSYEDYVPLFLLSVLKNVPNSFVEILVVSSEKFRNKNKEAMAYLEEKFKDRFDISDLPAKDFADSLRFVTDIKSKPEFVYITDIDIIYLRGDVVKTHLAVMAWTGLPYSNTYREGRKRMTGLHFTKYDAHYPVPDMAKLLVGKLNDEEILYQSLLARGYEISSQTERPVFGIHMSPNRYHIGEWGVEDYVGQWKAFKETEDFKAIYPHLSARIRNYLSLIDYQI
jgi:hypothetical protein